MKTKFKIILIIYFVVISFLNISISNEVINSTVPNPVTDLTGYLNDANFYLSWTAPSDGGSPILQYNVYYEYTLNLPPDSAENYWTFSTSTTQLNASGALNQLTMASFSDISFKVTAVNAIGESNWNNSNTHSIIIPSLPSPPTSLGISNNQNQNQIQLSWHVPINNGGGQIMQYNIYRTSDCNAFPITYQQIAYVDGNTYSYTDQNSNPGTYCYVTTAVNGIGESGYSNSVSININPITSSNQISTSQPNQISTSQPNQISTSQPNQVQQNNPTKTASFSDINTFIFVLLAIVIFKKKFSRKEI